MCNRNNSDRVDLDYNGKVANLLKPENRSRRKLIPESIMYRDKEYRQRLSYLEITIKIDNISSSYILIS